MADVGPIEYDILVNQLGWAPWLVDAMDEAQADRIVAEYAIGNEMRPHLDVPDPTGVAFDTFTTGVREDIVSAAGVARETVASLGNAAKDLAENAPLIVVGLGVLALVLFLK